MPIKALNQFTTDWRFKARIVKKPPMREYRNQKGTGKILNIDLLDREGTMI
jgi:replication factor A1